MTPWTALRAREKLDRPQCCPSMVVVTNAESAALSKTCLLMLHLCLLLLMPRVPVPGLPLMLLTVLLLCLQLSTHGGGIRRCCCRPSRNLMIHHYFTDICSELHALPSLK